MIVLLKSRHGQFQRVARCLTAPASGSVLDMSCPEPQPPRDALPWHFVATGYVISPDETRMLLVQHRKLGKWLPPGGHLEPGELPHHCAQREVLEETGIHASFPPTSHLRLTGDVEIALPSPTAILDELIPANAREPAHRHIDMIFMMKARSEDVRVVAVDEVSDVTWMTLQQLKVSDTFPAVVQLAEQMLRS